MNIYSKLVRWLARKDLAAQQNIVIELQHKQTQYKVILDDTLDRLADRDNTITILYTALNDLMGVAAHASDCAGNCRACRQVLTDSMTSCQGALINIAEKLVGVQNESKDRQGSAG